MVTLTYLLLLSLNLICVTAAAAAVVMLVVILTMTLLTLMQCQPDKKSPLFVKNTEKTEKAIFTNSVYDIMELFGQCHTQQTKFGVHISPKNATEHQ